MDVLVSVFLRSSGRPRHSISEKSSIHSFSKLTTKAEAAAKSLPNRAMAFLVCSFPLENVTAGNATGARTCVTSRDRAWPCSADGVRAGAGRDHEAESGPHAAAVREIKSARRQQGICVLVHRSNNKHVSCQLQGSDLNSPECLLFY